MELQDKIQAAIDELGIEYDQLEEMGMDGDQECLVFKFVRQKPAMGYLCELVSKVAKERFNGVQWDGEANELTVYYATKSEPGSSTS